MPIVMMTAPTSGVSEAVALTCMVLGVLLIIGGSVLGLAVSTHQSKLVQAKGDLDAAQQRFQDTRQQLESMHTGDLESVGGGELAGAKGRLHQATVDAESTTGAAKSALEQVSGIVGALPENLRFPGVLLLVGTVLVSVATIQFGGTSLF